MLISRLGLGLLKNIKKQLLSITNAYSNIVTSDGGVVESKVCLNNNLKALQVEDSTYTDYATRVDNSIGMVEASESEIFDSNVSSILNISTPNFLLIPNGRNNGKLFSLLPSDGSGDFTFTGIDGNGGRTRVNKAGNIEVVRRNILPISTTQHANWVGTTGFTRTNVNIKNNKASNVVVTSTQNGVDYQQGLRYNASATISLLSGSTYTISFRVKPNDGNGNFSYYILMPNGASINRQIGCSWNVFTGVTNSNYTEACTKLGRSITHEGNGIYLVSETFTLTENLVLINTLTIGFGNGLAVQTVGRNADFGTPQLELGSVPTSYQESDSGVSIPRIDYSSGSCSILVEPQRTNVCLNNETLSGFEILGGTYNSSSGIYTESSINEQHRISSAFHSGLSANTYYTWSAVVEQLSGATRLVFLTISNGATGEIKSQVLNLSTGAITGVINSADSNWDVATATNSFRQLPNGSWIISITARSTILSSSLIRVNPSIDGNSTNYLGSGITAYVRYFQTEAGTFPTSRIVTEGAGKTRVVDSLTASTPLLANQGTVIFEIAPHIIGIGQNNPFVKIGDLEIRANDNLNWTFYYDNASLGGYTASKTARVKFAFAFNGSSIRSFRNGTLVASPNNRTSTTLFTTLNITPSQGAFSIPMEKVIVFNTQLSDAQCIALTTL